MKNKNKPVLLQINTGITGSTGRIAQQIGELAIASGWDSWIAYSGREKKCNSQSHLIRIGNSLDTWWHGILTRLFDLQGRGSVLSTKKLIRQIKSINPDIIHLHNIHGYYLNYKELFSYLSSVDISVIWTFHDCWPFTGHCVHFTDVDCYKWKDGTCSSCPKKKSYPSSMVIDRSKTNYTNKMKAFTSINNLTVVPVSYWLGSVVGQSFFRDYNVKVIQNGIDVNAFYPRKGSIEKIRIQYGWLNKYVILGVAKGWSEDVGLSTFYKLREALDDEYAIAMVGVTKEQKEHLPHGITGILRTQDSEELAELYTAADVFFNGSFQETFGLVTAEAMACGTPAIVYNCTACPEIVDNDRGRIIPVKDFEKLLEAIRSLRDMTRDEKEKMSLTCAEYVRHHLDKNNKYKEYIQLYNKILSND